MLTVSDTDSAGETDRSAAVTASSNRLSCGKRAATLAILNSFKSQILCKLQEHITHQSCSNCFAQSFNYALAFGL